LVNCRKARKLERVVSKALAKGHRLHARDPRTARLLELAHETGFDGVHMKQRAPSKSRSRRQRKTFLSMWTALSARFLPIWNDPPAFNGIFMIARTPGSIAHVIEEQIRERRMRRIDSVNHGYDRSPPRSLSDEPAS
jgi:citrate synthase